MDESKFYAYCLQGDVTAAYDYLRSIPDKSKKYQELESRYFQRFFEEKPMYRFKTEDGWIRKVLLVYYQYFTAVLTGNSVKKAENHLALSLAALISDAQSSTDLDYLEDKLKVMFKLRGYSFLGGVTAPFRGPYIWKMTEKKEFTVELPHQTQEVTVYFLSNFIMQSWIHFSTFGEKFAGGWAKSDGLYYVNDRPLNKKTNFESSEFQISYLKHEAQHLSDYSRFPHLSAKDLEYRAKLVELIYEPKSIRLLKKFSYEHKNDPTFPHPYSSFVIMKRLTQFAFGTDGISDMDQWETVNPDTIHAWAGILYDEHSEQLEVSGEGAVGII